MANIDEMIGKKIKFGPGDGDTGTVTAIEQEFGRFIIDTKTASVKERLYKLKIKPDNGGKAFWQRNVSLSSGVQ